MIMRNQSSLNGIGLVSVNIFEWNGGTILGGSNPLRVISQMIIQDTALKNITNRKIINSALALWNSVSAALFHLLLRQTIKGKVNVHV